MNCRSGNLPSCPTSDRPRSCCSSSWRSCSWLETSTRDRPLDRRGNARVPGLGQRPRALRWGRQGPNPSSSRPLRRPPTRRPRRDLRNALRRSPNPETSGARCGRGRYAASAPGTPRFRLSAARVRISARSSGRAEMNTTGATGARSPATRSRRVGTRWITTRSTAKPECSSRWRAVSIVNW
jgi:hypothetical protein